MIEEDESQRAAMKEEIRKSVREEIQNSRNPQVTNIFSRTPDLISTATRAHIKALTTPPNSTFTFNSKKRSAPGHPNRFSRKEFRGGSVNRPKMLQLLLFPKQQGGNSRANNQAELINGYVEVFLGNSKVKIRKILTKLFKTRFTLISDKDYDFVKRIRNLISKLVTPDDFKWNFEAIKVFAGQGKLCYQLVVDENCLAYEGDPDLDSIISKSCFENEASNSIPFHEFQYNRIKKC